MRFSPERAARLKFNLFAIAAMAMLSGVPLACCLIMVAATRFANFVALGRTPNVNNPRKLLAAFNPPLAPRIIPDFAIHGIKYTESHSLSMFTSKPFL